MPNADGDTHRLDGDRADPNDADNRVLELGALARIPTPGPDVTVHGGEIPRRRQEQPEGMLRDRRSLQLRTIRTAMPRRAASVMST